jgi:hypothetical protein
MSSDAAELRKLVKELQNASTDEVSTRISIISPSFLFGVERKLADCISLVQDIKGILDILKRDFRVTEPILRVGDCLRRPYRSLNSCSSEGKQSGVGCREAEVSWHKGSCRFGERLSEEMEDRGRAS